MKREENNVVGVFFTGRLGNQLFVYAYARYLMEQTNQKHFLANFQGSRTGQEDDGFTDSIKHFQVVDYHAEDSNFIRHHGTIIQKTAYAMYALCLKTSFFADNKQRFISLNRALSRCGLFFSGTEDPAYHPDHICKCPIFVSGFFQDSRFFNDIRPLLVKELTPKYPVLAHNTHLINIAKQTNSVCVSIRRGDFLSEQYRKDFFLCGLSYFQKAINIMRSKVTDPVFIFFSDDIQWVKEHLHVDGCQNYYERGNDPVWEKLRLMYSCHHFIISNSTFSWWAQYLGRHEDKIVISPSQWYANPTWTSNLIEESFIVIDP